jgi:hypothetical protein
MHDLQPRQARTGDRLGQQQAGNALAGTKVSPPGCRQCRLTSSACVGDVAARYIGHRIQAANSPASNASL